LVYLLSDSGSFLSSGFYYTPFLVFFKNFSNPDDFCSSSSFFSDYNIELPVI